MIPRDYYIELIEDIRNVEKISIDDFIKEKLEPLMEQDKYFVETLYKDIHYLIKDIDKEGENDLAIENGDLVIESDGLRKEIKLTGYQSRLHQISIWLHMQIAEKFIQENPLQFIEKMENFEKHHLNKPNYTPEYKAKLDKIKESLKEERRQNLNEKPSFRIKVGHWIKKKKVVVFSLGGIIAIVIPILSFFQQITGYTLKDVFEKEVKIENLNNNEIAKLDSLVIFDKKSVVEKASKEIFENYYKTIQFCKKKYTSISAFNYIQDYVKEEIIKIDNRILTKSYVDRHSDYHKYWKESDYEDVSRIIRMKTIVRMEEIFEDVESQSQGPFVYTEDKIKLLQEMVEKEIENL